VRLHPPLFPHAVSTFHGTPGKNRFPARDPHFYALDGDRPIFSSPSGLSLPPFFSDDLEDGMSFLLFVYASGRPDLCFPFRSISEASPHSFRLSEYLFLPRRSGCLYPFRLPTCALVSSHDRPPNFREAFGRVSTLSLIPDRGVFGLGRSASSLWVLSTAPRFRTMEI